jgi:threonine aldolase
MGLIDLYSDTQTRPTAAMRRFMMDAPVGDEQKGEDPTVNLLQDMVADLLGKPASVFLPSATMANEIAIAVHTRPGDEIILDRTAHPVNFEGGGPAFHSGVMAAYLDGRRGIFTPEQVAAAIRPDDPHFSRSRLVSVENTTNLGGGAVWPLDVIHGVAAVARRHDLRLHLDGARLMNAVVAAGIKAADYAAPFDTVTICLTKGLGAPVGAVLAGSRDLMGQARRYKHLFGGAMRQAGIIAAGGVYALRHHVDRLAEDHANARALALGLAAVPGLALDPTEVETNIVIFDLTTGLTAREFLARIEARGVRMVAVGPARIRAVTHLDIAADDISRAVEAVAAAMRV